VEGLEQRMNTAPINPIAAYGIIFFIGIFSIASIVLPILATIRHVRSGERSTPLVLWLLYIWLVPIIGPIVALCNVPRRESAPG
jgi:hypothetical protein